MPRHLNLLICQAPVLSPHTHTRILSHNHHHHHITKRKEIINTIERTSQRTVLGRGLAEVRRVLWLAVSDRRWMEMRGNGGEVFDVYLPPLHQHLHLCPHTTNSQQQNLASLRTFYQHLSNTSLQ